LSRQIIILDRHIEAGDQVFRVAFWATVPAARQIFYADATLASAVKNAAALETTALQNGSTTERVIEFRHPPGVTLAQIQAQLVQMLTAFQTEINAAQHPFRSYGTSYDPTTSTWTMVTVV
jgi:hypothetical protein